MDLTPVVAGEHVPVQRAGVMMDAVPAVDGEFVAAAREAIKEGAVHALAKFSRIVSDSPATSTSIDVPVMSGDRRLSGCSGSDRPKK